jgi:hypothetical protein
MFSLSALCTSVGNPYISLTHVTETQTCDGATHPTLEGKNASTAVSTEQFLKHLMMVETCSGQCGF